MEDPAFPHLGDSSQPLPRACPWRCSCPRNDTVDCAGLGLSVFPDNITKAARHLSLQVRAQAGSRWEVHVPELSLARPRPDIEALCVWRAEFGVRILEGVKLF